MRHLERTHGISIGWMHAIFQEGYVSIACEVTAKMAADTHTHTHQILQGLCVVDARLSADQHLSSGTDWITRYHGFDAAHSFPKYG